MLLSELQTLSDVLIGEGILNSCHTTKETSLIEPMTHCACRGLDAKLSTNPSRCSDRCLGRRSHDRSVDILASHSWSTAARLILKAMMVLVMSNCNELWPKSITERPLGV